MYEKIRGGKNRNCNLVLFKRINRCQKVFVCFLTCNVTFTKRKLLNPTIKTSIDKQELFSKLPHKAACSGGGGHAALLESLNDHFRNTDL